MKLSENMRVKMSGDPNTEAFDHFTLMLGNGEAGVCSGTDQVELPDDMWRP